MRAFIHSHTIVGFAVAGLIMIQLQTSSEAPEAAEPPLEQTALLLSKVELLSAEDLLPEPAPEAPEPEPEPVPEQPAPQESAPEPQALANSSPEPTPLEPAAPSALDNGMQAREGADFAASEITAASPDRIPGVRLEASDDTLLSLLAKTNCRVVLFDRVADAILGEIDPATGQLSTFNHEGQFSSRVILLENTPSWIRRAIAAQADRSVRPLLVLPNDVDADLTAAQLEACRIAGKLPTDVSETTVALRPLAPQPFYVTEVL